MMSYGKRAIPYDITFGTFRFPVISKVIYILSAYLNISRTDIKQLYLYITMRSIVNTIIFICIND